MAVPSSLLVSSEVDEATTDGLVEAGSVGVVQPLPVTVTGTTKTPVEDVMDPIVGMENIATAITAAANR